MSLKESLAPPPEPKTGAERALRLPMGAISPLWLLYASAAGAGMAYWWMTRWARPVNLEALMGAGKAFVETTATAVVEATAPIQEAVVATADAGEWSLERLVIETAAVEAEAEPTPEPIAVVAAPVVDEPVPAAPPVETKPLSLGESLSAADPSEPVEIMRKVKPGPRRLKAQPETPDGD